MSAMFEHLDLTPEPRPQTTASPVQVKGPKWTLPGFGPMTRVSTSFGEVPAQTLRERDMIRTHTGQLKPIKTIDRIKLDRAFLNRMKDAHAVLIRAGSLGGGLPKADVLVSPGQFVGLGRHAYEVKYQRAGDLIGRPGIVRKPEEMMTYTTFDCGEPISVRMEGIWAKIGS